MIINNKELEKSFESNEYKSKLIKSDLIERNILLNYVAVTKLLLTEKDFKTTSLEWNLTSPSPAHTFAIAPKIITTAKHYAEYRWGAVQKKTQYQKFPLFCGLLEKVDFYNKTKYNNYVQPVHIYYNTQFLNNFLLGK
jgi:hypothetical protein